MRPWITAAIAVFGIATPAAGNAQQGSPYKLVLTWNTQAIVVVDYQNQARCDRAKQALDAEAERRREQGRRSAAENASKGIVTVGEPTTVYGFCIPG